MVKIDVLLAVWSLLAVYYTLKFNQKTRIKYHIAVGAFIGLSLATKPLTGLLIIPTVLLGHFFSSEGKTLIVRIKNFFNKKLFALFLSAITFNFLCNPYSLIDFRFFILSQYHIVIEQPFYDWYDKGWQYIVNFAHASYFGFFFVLLSLLGACYFVYKYIKTKKSLYLIIFSYPVIFFLAFAPLAAAPTFYPPIIPFLIIMMSKLIIDISEKIKFLILRYIFIVLMICLILFKPALFIYEEYYSKKGHDINLNAQVKGKDWIEENIPSMSKILLYGMYPSMPRIVDYRIQHQIEKIEDSFYEGKGEKKSYVESFKEAYRNHVKDGHTVFQLELKRTCPGCDVKFNVSEENLFEYCMKNNYDYVIASEELNMDKYEEFREKKFKFFGEPDYPIGEAFVIYKLK
jgi:hypothetical protein